MAKNELPKSWEWKRLGEVCSHIRYGLTAKACTQPVGPIFLRVTDIKDNGEVSFRDPVYAKASASQIERFRLQKGDIVIARSGSIGKAHLFESEREVVFASYLIKFRPDPNIVFPRFLNSFLHSQAFYEFVERGKTVAAQPNINAERLKSLLVPLPPFEEQRRIVARIEELLSRLEQAKSLRQKSKEEASNIFRAAVNDVFNFGNKQGWPEKAIKDIVIGKPQYGTSQKASENNSGIPLIRMGNIKDGKLSFYDLKFIQLPESEERKYLLQRGDILFNRTNSAELVGKTAVFSVEKKAVFASYLIRLKVDLEKTHPHFVVAYINSSFGSAYIQSQLTRAIGQVNVNAKKLLEMPILLPDIREQRRIVAYLDHLQEKVNELQHLQSETQKELAQTTQSILSQAFQGKL